MPASTTPAQTAPHNWRAALLVVGLTLAALVPFLGKAVHVDDYLFIRSARQIIDHPLDPFGTVVNWYGFPMPLAEVTQNPPGACYLLAAAIAIGGENEVWLHTVFLLPAVIAALGFCALAHRLGAAPLVATLVALATPVFWLSTTTLMSDVPMLACWVWAVVLWLRGEDRRSHFAFAGSALLVAAAGLTKYFGVSLLPLLLAYSFARHRRPTRAVLWLLIPVAVFWGYELLMKAQYGRGLLAAAGEYASTRDKPGEAWQRAITTLSFTGGCLLPVVFLAPQLWSWRPLSIGLAFAAVVVAVLSRTATLGVLTLEGSSLRWTVIAQVAIFATGGLAAILTSAAHLWRERSPEALLLALWIGGTLVFTGLLNWTINGRSLLPLAPAVAIVLVHALQARTRNTGNLRWTALWPLAPAIACAALVVHADAALADQSRQAARVIHEKLGGRASIWFQGHWGFQYYMEAAGALPIDKKRPAISPGDYLITPEINTNLSEPPSHIIETFGSVEIASPTWVATMNIKKGVGFYSDSWGPLPFGVVGPHGQRFDVARVRVPSLQFR